MLKSVLKLSDQSGALGCNPSEVLRKMELQKGKQVKLDCFVGDDDTFRPQTGRGHLAFLPFCSNAGRFPDLSAPKGCCSLQRGLTPTSSALQGRMELCPVSLTFPRCERTKLTAPWGCPSVRVSKYRMITTVFIITPKQL